MQEKDIQKKMMLYLQRLDILLFNKRFPQDIEELKDRFRVAREEMKLNKKELKQFHVLGKSFLKEAEILLQKKKYQKCIRRAQKSAKLLPSAIRPKEILLSIYTSEPEIKNSHIKKYAHFVLLLDPQHEEAQIIVSQKESPLSHIQNKIKELLERFSISLPILGAIFITIIMISVVIIQSMLSKDIEKSSHPENGKDISIELPKSNIPLEIIDGREFMKIEDRGSKISLYDTSLSYQLSAIVTNVGYEEYTKILGEIRLLNKHGKVIASAQKKLRGTYEQPLREGQSDALSHLLYVNPLAKGYLPPVKVQLQLLEVKYATTPSKLFLHPVTAKWEIENEELYPLSIQRRGYVPSKEGSSWMHNFGYEITNTGQKIIHKLKFRCDFLNAQGQVIASEERLLTFPNRPPLIPQETRLLSIIKKTQAAVESIQLYVIEIEEYK